MPNITGDNVTRRNVVYGSDGVFVDTKEPSQPSYKGGSSSYLKTANFDASRSNTTYGNSTTVTPLSLSTKLILKY